MRRDHPHPQGGGDGDCAARKGDAQPLEWRLLREAGRLGVVLRHRIEQRRRAGGYPLFADGKIVGAIGVGGGTEAQDCEIAEHVVKVFEELIEK